MRSGLDRILRHTSPNGDGSFVVAAEAEPTPAQRARLVMRRDELYRAVAPGDTKRLRAAVAMVCGTIKGEGNEDPEGVVAVYCLALSDLPSWAAEEACAAALRGRVGKTEGRFRPSPAEIHLFAERLRDVFVREKLEIDKALNARVERPRLSQEERKAIVARARRTMAGAA